MERVWLIVVVLALAAGCQPRPPMDNPFLPRTTVPPPGTFGADAPLYGAAPSVEGVPPAAAYPSTVPNVSVPSATVPGATLPSATLPSTTIPPTTMPSVPSTAPPATGIPTAPATVPPANNQYYPPSESFDMRQSALPAPPGEDALAVADGPVPEMAPVDPLVRTGEEFDPRRKRKPRKAPRSAARPSESLAAASESPAPVANDDSGTEIAFADAPVAREEPPRASSNRTEIRIVGTSAPPAAWSESTRPRVATPTSGEDHLADQLGAAEVAANEQIGGSDQGPHRVARQAADAGDQVALVSYVEPATRRAGPRGQFNHDPGYQALSGKLEYSASTRLWKLRYIPIDGETDAYGGSVVLADSQLLDGFRPGEFVAVRGRVASDRPAGKGFAPRYEVDNLERQ